MEHIYTNGIKNFVISTNQDYYNINDWEVYLHNLDINQTINETSNIMIIEIVKNVSELTSSLIKDSGINNKQLEIVNGDGSKFRIGQVIKITNSDNEIIYRRIKNIQGDVLMLQIPISINLTAGTNIALVGNTGDYRCILDFNAINSNVTEGSRYIVQVKSNSAGIDISTSLFALTGYDIKNNLGKDIKYIKNSLDNLSSGLVSASISFSNNPASFIYNLSTYLGITIEDGGTLDYVVTDDQSERYIHVVDGVLNLSNGGDTYVYGENTIVFLKNIVLTQTEYNSLNIEHVVVLPGVNLKIT